MLSVGHRVQVFGDRGTVRYVGAVENQRGAWVGIEWDDPSRGKHDGSVNGKRYFSTAHETGGSFVRMEKVPTGNSLVDALLSRYHNEVGEYGSSAGDESMYVQTASRRLLKVQLVGLDQVQERQSRLELLKSARLVGLGISSVGDTQTLSNVAPALEELVLADNLISSWADVEQICTALPTLTIVDLSLNRLALPPALPVAGLQPLPYLKALVLNRTNAQFQQVLQLEACLPALQELHLCGNAIASLAPAHPLPADALQHAALRSLQVLNLEDNDISHWAEVARLSALPALTRLHLSNNPIPSVSYPTPTPGPQPSATAPAAPITNGDVESTTPAPATTSPQQPAAPFQNLQALLMGRCRLSSWACIDQMDRFPAVAELRVSDNPLLQDARGGGRFEVIGRVGGLTILNGAAVGPRERRDAEIRYLQNILAEAAASPGAGPAAAGSAAAAATTVAPGAAAGAAAGANGQAGVADGGRQHPRLQLLLQKYGAVCFTAAAPAVQGKSLAATTAALRLTCPARSRSLTKKIPTSITIGNLKTLLEKLFRLPAEEQELRLMGAVEGPEGLDIGGDDTQQLAFFDVEDGQEVVVLEVDAAARSQAAQQGRAHDAAALQQRLQDQGRVAERLQQAAVQQMQY